MRGNIVRLRERLASVGNTIRNGLLTDSDGVHSGPELLQYSGSTAQHSQKAFDRILLCRVLTCIVTSTLCPQPCSNRPQATQQHFTSKSFLNHYKTHTHTHLWFLRFVERLDEIVPQSLELVEPDARNDVLAHDAGGDEIAAVFHRGGTENCNVFSSSSPGKTYV